MPKPTEHHEEVHERLRSAIVFVTVLTLCYYLINAREIARVEKRVKRLEAANNIRTMNELEKLKRKKEKSSRES